jgi:hypothetical protein
VVIKASPEPKIAPTLAVSFTYLIMPDYYYYLRSIEYWREVKVLTSYVELMVSLTSIEYWREVKVLNSYVELIVSLTLLGYLYKKIPAKNLPCGVSRPKFYMWSLVYCVEIYGWNCFGKPLKKIPLAPMGVYARLTLHLVPHKLQQKHFLSNFRFFLSKETLKIYQQWNPPNLFVPQILFFCALKHRQRRRKNAINSGPLVPWQHTQAAWTNLWISLKSK